MTLPGLVVVGYRRADSLQAVLDSVPISAVSNLYICLDGPRGESDRQDVASVQSVAREAVERWGGRGHLAVRKSNVGSAVNLLQSVSFGLCSSATLIVLEDDCIPSTDFWAFTREMLSRYEADRSVLCVCGSQLVPGIAPNVSHVVSDYPLFWGWATWRSKWHDVQRLLHAYLYQGDGPPLRHLSAHARAYWRAGFRRSSTGFVDAWDIPLQNIILEHHYKAVLPSSNLVRNTGNDARATHVNLDSPWTRVPLGAWTREGRDSTSAENGRVNSWLEENVFGIRRIRLASTAITRGLDFAGMNRKSRRPLRERLID